MTPAPGEGPSTRARVLGVVGAVGVLALSVLPAMNGLPWLPPLAILAGAGLWWWAGLIPEGPRDRMRFAAVLGAVVLLQVGIMYRGGTFPWRGLADFSAVVLIYALFTLGLSIQYAFCGLINFGHVASLALGAYSVGLVMSTGGLEGPLGVAAALTVGILVSMVWAAFLGIPTLRLREDYLAIVTIAAGEVLRFVLNSEPQWTRGAAGIVGIPYPFGPLKDVFDVLGRGVGANMAVAVVVLGVVALLGWGLHRLVTSPWGRVVRAVRDDEDAAAGLGVPVVRVKMQVLLLGSAVAAVAGAFLAWQRLHVAPLIFNPLPTFYAWSILILGGLGSLRGVIAGSAIFWTFLLSPRWVEFDWLDGQRKAAMAWLLTGLLLMIMVLAKPEGLFGDREELEVME